MVTRRYNNGSQDNGSNGQANRFKGFVNGEILHNEVKVMLGQMSGGIQIRETLDSAIPSLRRELGQDFTIGFVRFGTYGTNGQGHYADPAEGFESWIDDLGVRIHVAQTEKSKREGYNGLLSVTVPDVSYSAGSKLPPTAGEQAALRGEAPVICKKFRDLYVNLADGSKRIVRVNCTHPAAYRAIEAMADAEETPAS